MKVIELIEERMAAKAPHNESYILLLIGDDGRIDASSHVKAGGKAETTGNDLRCLIGQHYGVHWQYMGRSEEK